MADEDCSVVDTQRMEHVRDPCAPAGEMWVWHVFEHNFIEERVLL